MFANCPWCSADIDAPLTEEVGTCPDCGGEYTIHVEVDVARTGPDPFRRKLPPLRPTSEQRVQSC